MEICRPLPHPFDADKVIPKRTVSRCVAPLVENSKTPEQGTLRVSTASLRRARLGLFLLAASPRFEEPRDLHKLLPQSPPSVRAIARKRYQRRSEIGEGCGKFRRYMIILPRPLDGERLRYEKAISPHSIVFVEIPHPRSRENAISTIHPAEPRSASSPSEQTFVPKSREPLPSPTPAFPQEVGGWGRMRIVQRLMAGIPPPI